MNLTKIYFIPKPNGDCFNVLLNSYLLNGTIYKEFYMKVLSLKALTCALLTTTLLFNANLAFAEPTVTNESATIQQIVHLNKTKAILFHFPASFQEQL